MAVKEVKEFEIYANPPVPRRFARTKDGNISSNVFELVSGRCTFKTPGFLPNHF